VDRPVERCSSTRAAARVSVARQFGGRRAPCQDGHDPAEGTQQVEVPLPAARLFEIRLEEEGQVAEAMMALFGGLVDGRQPAGGPGLPLLQARVSTLLGQSRRRRRRGGRRAGRGPP
jgi:hypothetical protein